MVVDNRAGAGSLVGTDLVAKSPPDGYTLLVAASALTIIPSMYRNVPFDPHVLKSLIATELQPRHVQLRGCQPRDLIDLALSLAEYTGQPRVLTTGLMSAACATYFISHETHVSQ